MINKHEVAFIKTTGEAVFVLHTGLGIDADQTTVRRPVMGQDGIRHIVENFNIAELETQDEQRKRMIAERKEMLAQIGTGNQSSPAGDDGFQIN